MAPLATNRKDRLEGLDLPFSTNFSKSVKHQDHHIQPNNNKHTGTTKFLPSSSPSSSTQIFTSIIHKEEESKIDHDATTGTDVASYDYEKERQQILHLAVRKLPGIIQVMSTANKNLGNSASEIQEIRSIWKNGSCGKTREN